jgi:hypothetical protein
MKISRRAVAISWALLACPMTSLGQEPVARGLKLLVTDQYLRLPTVPLTVVHDLPPKWDLSADFPVPGDQRPQQACAAWAVGYGVKSYQERKERNWAFNSETMFSPSFIYNTQTSDAGCQEAMTLPQAMSVVTELGVASLADLPFESNDCSRQPSDDVALRALKFFAAGFRKTNGLDGGEIKRLIYNGTPVIVAILVGEKFARLARGQIYDEVDLSALDLAAHAMVVVGYDNDKQAFLLYNSWGPDWADSGLGWISYRTFADWVREAYVLYDALEDDRPARVVETIYRSESPAEPKFATKSTHNNHCERDCKREPTRRNYTLSLDADPGFQLRNPRITCLSGPCGGWRKVHWVRLENGKTRAKASWDTWSHPTTWQLSADQVRLEELRFPQRVAEGGTFSVTLVAGSAPPLVRVTNQEGETLQFKADSRPSTPLLREVARTTSGALATVTFQVGSKG